MSEKSVIASTIEGIWPDVWHVAVVLGVTWIVHWVFFWGIERITKRTAVEWDAAIARHLRGPARLGAMLLALQFTVPGLALTGTSAVFASHGLDILSVVAIAWITLRAILVLEEILLSRFEMGRSNNLESRKVHTQVRILHNVVVAVLVVVASAMVLMTFPGVRRIGVSLLASAGIAGVILGLAAQKTIGNLLAGIQLALTQPIRIDDVVIVENEWGWIEEITLTYVVVKIWDLRRLILPISYFIERPIQNWTRSASEIMGTVVIPCDQAADVDLIRAEASRIAALAPQWDRKVCVVQVVDCRAEAMDVRILVSATDSGMCWDLRCHMRERLLDFLRREHPEWLPRRRVQMDDARI